MQATLMMSALLMGLAGGPHCAAMCGAACAGLGGRRSTSGAAQTRAGLWHFQAGRLIGYSLAGAVAAQAVEGFAWLTSQTAALRPAWTFFHLGVLAWGLTLLLLARQPAWVVESGRSAWSRLHPLAGRGGGVFVAGLLWTFMPCSLLYSALLVASLSGGPLGGAVSMALFAGTSGLSLSLMPILLRHLNAAGVNRGREWGARLSGLLLVLSAAWALGVDMVPRLAQWCGIA